MENNMSYLDDWLEAMTEGTDPQEAAQLRKTVRGPTLRDLLGAQDSFQIMGPNGQVDQARTDELLNRPDRGPTIRTPQFSMYSPSGKGLDATTAANLQQLVARNPQMARSPEENAAQYEKDIAINAYNRDPQAMAEMNRRKAINDANQLNFKMLVDLAKGDPETASALLSRLMPGLPKGRTADEKLADQTRIRTRVAAEEKMQADLNAPLGEKASNYVHQETGQNPHPDMLFRDVKGKGSQYLSMDGGQKKVREGLINLSEHSNLAEQYLNELPSGGWRGWNNFKMWLRAQQNDPAAVGLAQQLESMTPVALGKALGGTGRGGAILAQMLKQANITPSDSRETAIEKLQNMRKLAVGIARENGLPVAPFEKLFEGTKEKVGPGGGPVPTQQSVPGMQGWSFGQ